MLKATTIEQKNLIFGKKKTDLPRVVVVGAGFGGVEAIRHLSKMKVEVIIVDRNNYHEFTPLLYQVATASVENEEIIFPIRKLIRKKSNVHFIRDKVVGIDKYTKHVTLTKGYIEYDYLILGIGARTAYHGIPGAKEFAFPMKHLSQAMGLKNHILTNFEKAELENDKVLRKQLLTFVIVGAGPTGVEFAGAVSELIFGALLKDYPIISKDEISIHIVDSGDYVLKQYDLKLSKYATERIEKMGIKFEKGVRVSNVSPDHVTLSDGTVILTKTVVWSAGIQGHEFVKNWGFEYTRNNLIKTKPTLQSSVDDDIFVVGDMGDVIEKRYPALATVAIQQGAHAAKNICAKTREKPLKEFSYKDRGTMAVIGRNAAVVQTKRLKLKGGFAWLIWSAFHIFKMGGLRNRLNIMINWFWSYIFSDHSSTVITTNLK